MEERLIEFVRKNKFLYDKKNKNYKNARLREQKYDELAKKLKVPAKTLKDRWRTLRDKFFKELKFQPGSSLQSSRKWKWMDHLSFLKDVNTENLKNIGKFEKIVPEVYLDDARQESMCEFLEEDSTPFSTTNFSLLDTSPTSAQTKIDEIMHEAKTDHNERAQSTNNFLRKRSTPKKSSIQLFCDSLASQIEEANLSQFEVASLQIALLKTFQNFLRK